MPEEVPVERPFMRFVERAADLFDLVWFCNSSEGDHFQLQNISPIIDGEQVAIVHCISADVAFNSSFARRLIAEIGEDVCPLILEQRPRPGDAVWEKGVYHLIVKEHSEQQANASDFLSALNALSKLLIMNGEKRLILPTILCGSDGYSWHWVRNCILSALEHWDGSIIACI